MPFAGTRRGVGAVFCAWVPLDPIGAVLDGREGRFIDAARRPVKKTAFLVSACL